MKFVALGLIGVGVLGAAVWGSLSALNNKAAVTSSPSVVASQSSNTSVTRIDHPDQNSSSFDETAKETCGDPPDANATWYEVFIDGGNLNEVHRRFCKDAIAVNRQDTGRASIQVASFTDRSRAEAFARTVGGEASRYEPNLPKKVAEAKSSESSAKMRQAIESYASKNYEQSLKLFQEIIEEDPTNARVWRNLGEAYHATGDDHNATLAMSRSREIYLQNGDENGASQVDFQIEGWKEQGNTETSVNSVVTPSHSSSGSGRCNSPDDVDIRGRRCGGRAKGMRRRSH